MIKHFLENPFEDKKMSLQELYDLASKSIEFMTLANTGGLYSETIKNLQPNHTALKDWFDSQTTSKKTPKFEPRSVKEIISDFENLQKKINKELKNKIKSDETISADLYPEGKKKKTHITKNNIQESLSTLVGVCTKYPSFITKETANAVKKLYKELKEISTFKKGLQLQKEKEKNLRKEVAEVLYENLLQHVKINVSNPEDVLTLYPQNFKKKTKKK